MTVAFNRERKTALRNTAFGFALDILRNESVVETVRMPPQPVVWPSNGKAGTGGNVRTKIPSIREWNQQDSQDRWTVRVRGDAEMALRDWNRDKYWAGEFTLPLDQVLRRE